MELAANLRPVQALIGTWRGPGRGEYPTIDPFEYTEEVTFADIGKPFLTYIQRTWSPEGTPMHTESGFLRMPGGDGVEFTLAQPTGQVELATGSLATTDARMRIDLMAALLNSGSATAVQATRRMLSLTADELTTTLAMAAVGQPMTHHLVSVLRRV